ncbi:hypothetical protein VRU48_06125 [Pedobacter sp. KR3-3]|uniref:DUF1461 domain-containing protein n=1 Tax=Pedobacter albus TaxID=3113905 RepID=A0ABU7I5S3_9SPHI|nr:hypothetical protein [Pedobacter sp. KR3-3]MEE1944676.1 hypothetical protein [Pedobacter sp. KR3-3]
MKKLLFAIFIAIVLIMGYQGNLLHRAGFGIINLELANDGAMGKHILQQWHNSAYGEGTLLDIAKQNVRLDYLFIVVYVILLMALANSLMQLEKSVWLNNLLRFNLFLAPLTGLLDVIENLMIQHNFHHVLTAESYCNPHWVALVKFVFAGFGVLVLLWSYLKSAFTLNKVIVM